MKSRKDIFRQIKTRFETAIAGVMVLHTGKGGYSDDEDDEDIENFEVLNVTEEHYDKFLDVVSEVRKQLVWPNGFSISVHALSPEATLKHRSKELRIELRRRYAAAAQGGIRESWDHRKVAQVFLVGLGSTITKTWEMDKDSQEFKVQHIDFKTKESKNRECERDVKKPVQWDGNGSAPAELQSCCSEAA